MNFSSELNYFARLTTILYKTMQTILMRNIQQRVVQSINRKQECFIARPDPGYPALALEILL